MLIWKPAEAIKMALEIKNFIDRLFNPLSLEILSKIFELSGTSLYGRVLWVGFGGPELHSTGSTENYEMAMCHFQ